MNARQFATLEKVIDAWMDDQAGQPDWPNIIIGNRTVELMAHAARSVFDACEESHEYAEREGLLKAAYGG